MSNDAFVSSTREIRAPLPHVRSLAIRLETVMSWIWAPAQVADPAASRDLPNGTRQLIVRDGDKLRTRVAEQEERRVVIEAVYQPRNTDVPGRELRYELNLEVGAGTTMATLSLHFAEPPSENPGEIRRWTRNLRQCLDRLDELAAGEVNEAQGAEGDA
ncbi:MAG TPA: hypothetical protein DIU15_08315 [Deltaproteobacteria bacterium]|nr:hypothetical protein [Deltaproteobacteria bacterium]HCP46029.1 hypothetical protein [Deltaproteobacteria bacterium]